MKTQNLLILYPLFLVTTTLPRVAESRSSTAASINEGRKYTCIVNYLRVKGVIGLEFGTTENTLDSRCVSIVENAKVIELKYLKEQLTAGEGESDEILADCIVEELRRKGFEKSALLRFVYEIAPQYTSHQRDDRINDIEAQINRDIYKSNILCNADNSYRGLFDDDGDENDVKLTPREDYCIRRYIVENDLVKVKGVKLDVVELDKEVDCTKKLVKALIKMENNFLNDFIDQNEEDEQLRAIQRDCFLKATHEGDFLKRTLVFDYMKELTLTPRQRGQMKNGYVKLLTEFAEKSAECV